MSARHGDRISDISPSPKHNVHQRSDNPLVCGPLIRRASVFRTILRKWRGFYRCADGSAVADSELMSDLVNIRFLT